MADDIVRVWIVTSYEQNDLPFFTKEFKGLEENLKLHIELKMTTWDKYYISLMNSLKDHSAPDVFQIGSTWVRTLAYLDYLDPVPDNMKCDAPLADWMNECSRYRGVKIAMPWIGQTIGLTIRQDLLSLHGLRGNEIHTPADFLEVCTTLRRQMKTDPHNEHPFLIPVRREANTLHNFLVWFYSLGGAIPKDWYNSKSILHNETAQETVVYLTTLLKANGLDKEGTNLHPHVIYDHFFEQGKYAFLQGNFRGIHRDPAGSPRILVKENNPYELLPIPSNNHDSYHWGGGSMLGVSKHSRNPSGAWKIVEHILSEQFTEQWTLLSGNLPAYESPFWNKYLEYGHVGFIHEQMKHSTAYPFHPLWGSIERIISPDIASLLQNTISSSEPIDRKYISSCLQKIDDKIKRLTTIAWEMEKIE